MTSISASSGSTRTASPCTRQTYLPWSSQGPAEGDLVFVSGHPGTTNRLDTLDKLKHRRDVTIALHVQNRLRMLEALLSQFCRARPRASTHGPERPAPRRQRAQGDLRPVPRACSTPPSWLARPKRRTTCAGKIAADPAGRTRYASAWAHIADAREDAWRLRARTLPDRTRRMRSKRHLFRIARHLVRLAAEKPKPNADPFARIPRLEPGIAGAAAFFAGTDLMPSWNESSWLGCAQPSWRRTWAASIRWWSRSLAGKAPAARAEELVERNQAGGSGRASAPWPREAAGHRASASDPMIRFAPLSTLTPGECANGTKMRWRK